MGSFTMWISVPLFATAVVCLPAQYYDGPSHKYLPALDTPANSLLPNKYPENNYNSPSGIPSYPSGGNKVPNQNYLPSSQTLSNHPGNGTPGQGNGVPNKDSLPHNFLSNRFGDTTDKESGPLTQTKLPSISHTQEPPTAIGLSLLDRGVPGDAHGHSQGSNGEPIQFGRFVVYRSCAKCNTNTRANF